MNLTNEEVQRYSRHLILPEVGTAGQEKLKTAKILLIGAGGLGSPLAMYLASAGVGKIGIVDFDKIEFSNLQRQVIHKTKDVGSLKAESAKRFINEINPNVDVEIFNTRLSSKNALDIISGYNLVIDGTDNFPTRYLVNDACVLLKKPNIYGSIYRFDGQASLFDPKSGSCYRCLYPEPPPPGMVPSCAEGGVLGILPGIVGLIQATEAIKFVIGIGENLTGRLLLFNALKMEFRELKLKKDPNCPICSKNSTITELIDYNQFCGITNVENTESQVNSDLTPLELKSLIDSYTNFTLLDVREPHEFDICNIEGAILIPIGELASRVEELDQDKQTIVYCRSGMRGGRGKSILIGNGFKNVKNLKGGILAWADDVDSNIPKY